MLENLKAANLIRWKSVQVNTSAVEALDKVAARLVAAKARYQAVEAKTNVPWPVIAVIHEREASQSWMANLAQGDRWDRVSTHVPKGQGPFKSWEEAAINALKTDKLNTWGDWSPEGTMTALEKYNGLGYNSLKKPSPYVWSKTNQYVRGKYVADHEYDPNAVDKQNGCAALLLRMMKMDPTINTKYQWLGKSTTVTVSGATAAATTAVVATAATAHQWPEHIVPIVIGFIVVASVLGLIIHEYKNRKVTDVTK